MDEKSQKIKEITQQLLEAMDFEGRVFADDSDQDFLKVNIQSDDAAFLIGRGGENLMALQLILRAIVNRIFGETTRFVVDVNDYQNSRFELLKEISLGLAKEVIEKKEPRSLSPMNAYERRIVHMALAGMEGIKTESEGEGEQRRIVIKPA